jgi:hypothetical protein
MPREPTHAKAEPAWMPAVPRSRRLVSNRPIPRMHVPTAGQVARMATIRLKIQDPRARAKRLPQPFRLAAAKICTGVAEAWMPWGGRPTFVPRGLPCERVRVDVAVRVAVVYGCVRQPADHADG